jgi:hypothetical protein
MKQFIAVLLISCIFQVNAQVRIRNLSLSKPDTNLAYYQLENRISIEGITKGTYSISVVNADLDTSDGLTVLKPHSTDSTVKLEIHTSKGKTFAKTFKVVRIPKLSYMVSGRMSNVISKETLLQFPKVELVHPNCCYIPPEYQIFNMDVAIARKGEPLIDLYCRSGNFSAQMIYEIKLMKPGDKLYLENIKCGCTDCIMRTLRGIVITIQ